jgi:hypothetical protein
MHLMSVVVGVPWRTFQLPHTPLMGVVVGVPWRTFQLPHTPLMGVVVGVPWRTFQLPHTAPQQQGDQGDHRRRARLPTAVPAMARGTRATHLITN